MRKAACKLPAPVCSANAQQAREARTQSGRAVAGAGPAPHHPTVMQGKDRRNQNAHASHRRKQTLRCRAGPPRHREREACALLSHPLWFEVLHPALPSPSFERGGEKKFFLFRLPFRHYCGNSHVSSFPSPPRPSLVCVCERERAFIQEGNRCVFYFFVLSACACISEVPVTSVSLPSFVSHRGISGTEF